MKFKLLLFSYLLLFLSCKSGREQQYSNVKDEPRATSKALTGKLSPQNLKEIRELLTTELKTTLDPNKAILINFNQYFINCFDNTFNKEERRRITDNMVSISSRFSAEGNAQDFFVYTKDATNADNFASRKNFILDSGFFTREIFTVQENCSAFIVIMPDGRFKKYYGPDYFTDVRRFLKQI